MAIEVGQGSFSGTPGDASDAMVRATGSTTSRRERDRWADVVNVKDFGAACDGTTDDTAAVNAAIAEIAGTTKTGGTIIFPRATCRIDGQLVIPQNGASPPLAKPLRFIGSGVNMTGAAPPVVTNANGGTILDMRYAGTYGKILALGFGYLEIAGITFTDGSGGTLPWIYTTNTTLHIHNNAFFGSKTTTACDQDAIILGGAGPAYGTTTPTDGFQGYGTVIRDNYFNRVRRAIYGRAYANSIAIHGNTIWRNSGSNLAGGAAIEFDSGGVLVSCAANSLSGNLIELDGYVYGVKFTDRGSGNVLSGNGFWDQGGSWLADVYWGVSTNLNVVVGEATISDNAGAGQNAAFAGRSGVGNFGPKAPTTIGNVLNLYSPGAPRDQAFMAFWPRRATPGLRGAYFGFASDGTTTLTLQSELGDLSIGAPSGNGIKPTRPLILNRVDGGSPATGTVTFDANTYQQGLYRWSTAAGTWTVALSNGVLGQRVTITIMNTSGGAVNTIWGGGTTYKMAAWVEPANGFNRSITFQYFGSGVWYEMNRTTVDVPN